jgi:DNA-binding transcriptional LysR family regulator
MGAAIMHTSHVFNWDDLKYLLGVARHGSTLAAGRALGVDQSTVQRRLTELERRLGQPLVQRQPAGYRLTEFGQAMLPHAERVEQAVRVFEQQLASALAEVTGVIRVTCPEPIIYRITQSTLLDRFRACHPALEVHFVMSDKYVDLMKGEADVALRSGDTEDGELVGRKIGDSIWAVYASRTYIERHGRPERIEDLAQHALVGLDETMAKHRTAAWLRKVAPDAALVARGHRCGAFAPCAWRRRARSRTGDRAGRGVDAHLARVDHAGATAYAAGGRVLRFHRRRDRDASPDHHWMSGRRPAGMGQASWNCEMKLQCVHRSVFAHLELFQFEP